VRDRRSTNRHRGIIVVADRRQQTGVSESSNVATTAAAKLAAA